MDWLDENEIRISKECAYNIRDKLNAIVLELNKEKPHKSYLKEKLDIIDNEVAFLLSLVNNKN